MFNPEVQNRFKESREVQRGNLQAYLFNQLFPNNWFRITFPNNTNPLLELSGYKSNAFYRFHYSKPEFIAADNEQRKLSAKRLQTKAPILGAITRWYVFHADENIDTVIKTSLILNAARYKFRRRPDEERKEPPLTWEERNLSRWEGVKLVFTPLVSYLNDLVASIIVLIKEGLTLLGALMLSLVYYPLKGLQKLFVPGAKVNTDLFNYGIALPGYRLFNKVVMWPYHTIYTLLTVLPDMYKVFSISFSKTAPNYMDSSEKPIATQSGTSEDASRPSSKAESDLEAKTEPMLFRKRVLQSVKDTFRGFRPRIRP